LVKVDERAVHEAATKADLGDEANEGRGCGFAARSRAARYEVRAASTSERPGGEARAVSTSERPGGEAATDSFVHFVA
jgi:hypothetical protein